jgi:hypothetical protein
MTDEILDAGVLGSADERRVEPEDTTTALANLLDYGTPADAVQFALGALDMVCVVCADLIGKGLVDPNAFQTEVGKRAALWRSMGNRSRAAAAEVLEEHLRAIERVKLKAKAHLVLPETRTTN